MTLYGLSRDAVKGSMDLSGHKKLEYRFPEVSVFSVPMSMEIEYSLTGTARPVLTAGGYSWILPGEGDFDVMDFSGSIFHYAIPVEREFPDYFSIVPASENRNRGRAPGRIEIHSITFMERWYGFYHQYHNAGNHIYASPFVSRVLDEAAPDNVVWIIDPPAAFNGPADFFPSLSLTLPFADPREGHIAIHAGNRRFEISPRLEQIIIPSGMITHNEKPLVVPADRGASFHLGYTKLPLFPAPLAADPGMILAWPRDSWRNRRYEIFRWEHFPSLLIFDTADYAVQNKLFKRLAFFVEKAGFRGRLAHDEEIADLHAWNAHDYRAEDLAHFFQTARMMNFPLLAEERELEHILFDAGIIRELGSEIQAGEGGIISISRESPDYLRHRFMAHEGFHGLFFIDREFRDFSRSRWQQLPAEAKRFIISFFGFQQYDIADEYLLINEFMAHVLQQPVSQAGYYFGQTLPSRLEDTWRRPDLPEKDQVSGSWPVLAAAFTREAEAFSAYVGGRWNLAAGRVHLATVRQP